MLDSKDYTIYKGYTIVNTVKNTKQMYNNLPLSGITDIFGMPLQNINNCPDFNLCENTDKRTNKVPLLDVYISQRPVLHYVKHPTNNLCSPSCYDTSINGKNKGKCNFFNTNFTTYNNYRLRKMKCNCKKI